MRDIFISILIGLGFFGVSLFGFSTDHALLIAIVAFLVTLWTNGALPLGVVSLLPLTLFQHLASSISKKLHPTTQKRLSFSLSVVL